MSENRETQIADLLRQARTAATLPEQREFVRQAEELRSEGVTAARESRQLDLDNAVIRDTLVPRPVHELHTAATDWVMDLEVTADLEEASRAMVAEASLWYGRVREDVKSYEDEYNEQARGLARRLAGQYGDKAAEAERVFLDEAVRLRSQAVRAGLVVESTDESYIDEPIVAEAASGLPEVGQDNYPTDVFSNLMGNGDLPPEATSSNRAPQLQELNEGSAQGSDVVPVNDPGLGQSDPTAEVAGNNHQPTEDYASKKSFPVSGSRKESSMYAQCKTCGGHGKVAVRTVEAASGLPEIDQIVNPNETPGKTPYPTDVAFPWTMDPNAQVPQAISQAEQQIAERNSKSPLVRGGQQPPQSTPRAQAASTRRDNSGWIGDNGARGIGYPGQTGEYEGDASTSVGFTNPVYGDGGDKGNQPLKPNGAMEDDDYTNDPDQNWQPGQPTQADQGWRETVQANANLKAALEYVAAHKAAYDKAQGK